MKKYILLVFLFSACSQQKQLEKAKQRVYTNREAFNEIGHKWAEINPIDTQMAKVIIISDTVHTVDTNIVTSVKYDTVTKEKVYTDVRFITRTNTIRDSVYNYVVDNRMLNAQKDSTNHYKELYFQSLAKTSDLEKKLFYNRALLYILLSVIVLGSALKLYLKFKP